MVYEHYLWKIVLATIISWEGNIMKSRIDLWTLLDISIRIVDDTQKELKGNQHSIKTII